MKDITRGKEEYGTANLDLLSHSVDSDLKQGSEDEVILFVFLKGF